MTDERMALLARLEQAVGTSRPDVLRETLGWAIEELMEREVTERLGARPNERTPERVGQRNGHRQRPFDSRVGTLELGIQEAYIKGISTRKVDDLVQAMGTAGISKSSVSRLCQELDTDLAAFRERRLEATRYPYLWLDAQYEKVRDGGRIAR